VFFYSFRLLAVPANIRLSWKACQVQMF